MAIMIVGGNTYYNYAEYMENQGLDKKKNVKGEDKIDNQIRELYNKRNEFGEEIQRLKYMNPRCPHCEKRFPVGDYSFSVVDGRVLAKCPGGDEFGIGKNIDLDNMDAETAKLLGQKINSLDYGYAE